MGVPQPGKTARHQIEGVVPGRGHEFAVDADERSRQPRGRGEQRARRPALLAEPARVHREVAGRHAGAVEAHAALQRAVRAVRIDLRHGHLLGFGVSKLRRPCYLGSTECFRQLTLLRALASPVGEKA